MDIACPYCQGAVLWDAATAGQSVSCPHCSGLFTMPNMQSVPQAIPQAVQQPQPGPQGQVVGGAPVQPGYGGGYYPPAPPKSEVLAAILSFLWVGLGQVYAGEVVIGLLLMFVAPGAIAVIAVFTFGFGLILFPVYWIGGIWHAYVCAANANRRATGMR